MALSYIFAAFVMCGCDSKTSTTNTQLNESVSEEEGHKTFQCSLCGGYGVYGGYTCNRCGGAGETVADYVETSSNSDVSFKGRSYYYGRCNGNCGCLVYEHAPGQTICINCAEKQCTVNKFGHKKEY